MGLLFFFANDQSQLGFTLRNEIVGVLFFFWCSLAFGNLGKFGRKLLIKVTKERRMDPSGCVLINCMFLGSHLRVRGSAETI